MKQESSTRDRIIRTALRLIRTKSYNSFSYKDIADEIGIKKSSIHYYFETKSILGLTVMQYFKGQIEYFMNKLNEIEDDPVIKLEKYMDFFRKGLHKNQICPAGVLTTEYNTLEKEIQEELKQLFNNYFTWLTDILREGKEKKVFEFSENPEDKALLVASSLEGGMLFARALDNNYFDRITMQIMENLLSKN